LFSLSLYPTVGFFYLKSHFLLQFTKKKRQKRLKDDETTSSLLSYFNRSRQSKAIFWRTKEDRMALHCRFENRQGLKKAGIAPLLGRKRSAACGQT
jgi:hypothetical protein